MLWSQMLFNAYITSTPLLIVRADNFFKLLSFLLNIAYELLVSEMFPWTKNTTWRTIVEKAGILVKRWYNAGITSTLCQLKSLKIMLRSWTTHFICFLEYQYILTIRLIDVARVLSKWHLPIETWKVNGNKLEPAQVRLLFCGVRHRNIRSFFRLALIKDSFSY